MHQLQALCLNFDHLENISCARQPCVKRFSRSARTGGIAGTPAHPRQSPDRLDDMDASGTKVFETIGAFVFKRLDNPGFDDDPS